MQRENKKKNNKEESTKLKAIYVKNRQTLGIQIVASKMGRPCRPH